MSSHQQFWTAINQFSLRNSVNFESLNRCYRIERLHLQKIESGGVMQRVKKLNMRRNSTEFVNNFWMQDEFRVFTWLVFVYAAYLQLKPENFSSSMWLLISQIFHKEVTVCKYFYFCLIRVKRLKWRFEEDQFVTKMMNCSQTSARWTQIGLEMFRQSDGQSVRKAKDIRERWISHLNPSINKSKWTAGEDLQLLRKVRDHGKSWSQIVKQMVSRSEHAIKNRYNKIIITNLIKKVQQNPCLTEDKLLHRTIRELQKMQINSNETSVSISQQNKTPEQRSLDLKCQFTTQLNRPCLTFQPIVISFTG